MSRIFMTFLIGMLIFALAVSGLIVFAINDDLIHMLNDVPLFRLSVEAIEEFINIETGNPLSQNNPVESFFTIIVLVLFMCLIKKIVDYVMNALGAQKPIDKIASACNKGIWNFVFSMGAVILVSHWSSILYDFMSDKFGEILTGFIICPAAMIILVLFVLSETFLHHQKVGTMFVYSIVFPVVKIIFMIEIMAFSYVAIKTQMYFEFGILILLMLTLCFLTDFFRTQFVKRLKVIVEN